MTDLPTLAEAAAVLITTVPPVTRRVRRGRTWRRSTSRVCRSSAATALRGCITCR